MFSGAQTSPRLLLAALVGSRGKGCNVGDVYNHVRSKVKSKVKLLVQLAELGFASGKGDAMNFFLHLDLDCLLRDHQSFIFSDRSQRWRYSRSGPAWLLLDTVQ